MNKENNIDHTPSKSFKQINSLNLKKSNKNNLYNDEFIYLINGLNESIKEYYKVCRHNISEMNNLTSYYEQQYQLIDILINDIINNNKYQKLNELYDMLNIIKEVIIQLKVNSNSNEKNLYLFFEDAKELFNKMKIKRKKKLSEINSNSNKINNQLLRNSYVFNPNHSEKKINNEKLNIYRVNTPTNVLMNINKIYINIMKLLNKFGDYNLVLNKMNAGMSSDYINLQNNIKKELELLMNILKLNLEKKNANYNTNNINTNIYSNKSFIMSNDQYNGKRSHSQSQDLNKEIEKIKKMNIIYEKKLKDLTNQLNIYKKNYMRESNNSKDTDSKKRDIDINKILKIKINKLEEIIKDKNNIIMSLDNNENNLINNNINQNLNNIIKIKDIQILNLQKELNVYQKNENILNNEILDLNNKVLHMKNKNNSLSQMIMIKNEDILQLQNQKKELNIKLNNLNITKKNFKY